MTIGQQRWFSPYYGGAKPLSTPTDCGPSAYGLAVAAKPRLLACSIDSAQQRLFALRELDRKLCEDRKMPLDHLLPGSLLKSTIRIVVTQSSLVLSNYATDQLQQDMARDKLVDEGKMTPAEAEDAAEEWETREWKVRWEALPGKLTEAFAKYHVIILVMRLYESIAARIVDKITLDALTLDTMKVARRLNAKEENKVDVGRQMFQISGQANLIAFLADYSVHQAILGYGYYVLFRERQRRQRLRREGKPILKEDGSEDDMDDGEDGERVMVKKSATLALSRGLGLAFTAVGGGVGSMLLPGWGTLLGSNLGDTLGGVVSDGFVAATSPSNSDPPSDSDS